MHVAVQVTLIIVGGWVVGISIAAFALWRVSKAQNEDTDEHFRKLKSLLESYKDD